MKRITRSAILSLSVSKWNYFPLQFFSLLATWFLQLTFDSWVCLSRPSFRSWLPRPGRISGGPGNHEFISFSSGKRRQFNDHQSHLNHRQSFQRRNRKSAWKVRGKEPSSAYEFKGMQCRVGINPADGRKRIQCLGEVWFIPYEQGFCLDSTKQTKRLANHTIFSVNI